MTPIRFQGGALDGRTAKLPGLVPPRGMDIAHDSEIERYGLERSEAGVVVYSFVSKRHSLSTRAPRVALGPFEAVPLGFYPSAAAGRRRAGSSPGP